MPPKKIAEGSYGCVFDPPFRCNSGGPPDYTNLVSKVMNYIDAKEEMTEYTNINDIQGIKQYAITKPIQCIPKLYSDDIPNIKRSCENEKLKYGKSEDFDILLLENGGINLKQLVNSNFLNTENDEEQAKFFDSLLNLIDGLIFFQENEIIHHDIKLLNIVYKKTTGKSKYIDFGLMMTFTALKDKCRNNTDDMSTYWENFLPYNECRNLDKYNECLNLHTQFPTHESFLNHVTRSFAVYSLCLALNNITPYLTSNKPSQFIIDYKNVFNQYIIIDPNIRNTDIKALREKYVEFLTTIKNYQLLPQKLTARRQEQQRGLPPPQRLPQPVALQVQQQQQQPVALPVQQQQQQPPRLPQPVALPVQQQQPPRPPPPPLQPPRRPPPPPPPPLPPPRRLQQQQTKQQQTKQQQSRNPLSRAATYLTKRFMPISTIPDEKVVVQNVGGKPRIIRKKTNKKRYIRQTKRRQTKRRQTKRQAKRRQTKRKKNKKNTKIKR